MVLRFMKRLKAKILRKKSPDKAGRITNETVAEHREDILAGGRRFKYPIQYVKHKLVLNSLLITATALLVMTALFWYLLYVAQYNSKFIYRLTQLVPVPVAQVDGHYVRYSDYLKKYRSDIFSLVKQEQIDLNSADGERQSDYYKRQELNSAIKDAYAQKLANELGISVSNAEIDAFITSSVNSKAISLEAYEKTVLRDFYDWSLDEYRGVVRTRLLTQRVSFAIDDAAKSKATELQRQAAAGQDFATLAKASSDDQATQAQGGDMGQLPIASQDPNGLIEQAAKLDAGQVSGLIQGRDGYYVIKLASKDTVNVRFSMIKVELKEFDKRFEDIKKQDKIEEYIDVE